MADRTVRVILSAATQQFQSGITAASGSLENFAKKADQSRGHVERISGTLSKIGLIAAVGLGVVSKQAMDWESAWAGVTKTVDGTAQELAGLHDGLREMARTLPASHTQIAAVAEAAGQLGVSVGGIEEFTRVMIDLGETTNLTADEAATSIAQMSNVMGTATDDVDRLGATIVALGNDGASTERDIVSMAQRIAAAGKTAGLSEAQVLGLSSALSSVGIEAEAGGSAVSKTIIEIGAAVRKGGDDLDLMARTAGMSADAFKKAWQTDAAGALNAFVSGLGRMQAAGGDAYGVLDELGMSGIRQADSIMRLAQSGDLLTRSIETGTTAWRENTALVDEATKRYETAESKVKIAFNNITDAGIEFGGVILPVLADAASVVADLAKWFGQLPGPVKTAAVGLAAIAAAGGITLGVLVKLYYGVRDLQTAYQGIIGEGTALSRALEKVGANAKGIAVGLAAATAASMIAKAAFAGYFEALERGLPAGRQMEMTLADIGKSGGSVDKLAGNFAGLEGRADDLAEAFIFLRARAEPGVGMFFQLGDAVDGLAAALVGGKTDLQGVTEAIQRVDAGLAGLSTEDAAAAFRRLSDETDRFGGSSAQAIVDQLPQYRDKLLELAQAAGVTNLSAEELVDWMGGKVPPAVTAGAAGLDEATASALGFSDAAADAAAETKKLNDEMMEAASVALRLSGSQIAVEEAVAKATKTIAENGRTHDITAEKGRANQRALDDIASSSLSVREAQMKANASAETINATMAENRERFLRAAEAAGYTADQARALADEYKLIPQEVETKVTAPGATQSKGQVDDLNRSVGNVPKTTTANISTVADLSGVEAAKRAIASVTGKTVTINVQRSGFSGGGGTSGGGGGGWAFGGPIYGPGTTKSDSIPAMLSNREFVHQAEAHDYYGSSIMWALNERKIPRETFARLGFAGGGSPASMAPPVLPTAQPVTTAAAFAPGPVQLVGELEMKGSKAVIVGVIEETQRAQASRGRAERGYR